MDNPSILNSINTKLQLSSVYDVNIGTGLKTFIVNPTPMKEIHTGHLYVSTTGFKYLTGDSGAQIALGGFNILTDVSAKLWEVNTNTAGLIRKVKITGVDSANVEQSEDVDTCGTILVLTKKSYKMVNDIELISGGTLIELSGGTLIGTHVIFCRPKDGLPQDQRIQISANYKYNPFFMCSNKNGLVRKARLRSVNSASVATVNSNIGLHVFNNNVSVAPNNYGIQNVKYYMYNVATAAVQGITFPEDGIVELSPGDLAVFYRENASTTITAISFTWSYYYTS
jgi:hypothetical protein